MDTDPVPDRDPQNIRKQHKTICFIWLTSVAGIIFFKVYLEHGPELPVQALVVEERAERGQNLLVHYLPQRGVDPGSHLPINIFSMDINVRFQYTSVFSRHFSTERPDRQKKVNNV